ncbi:MAG: HDIG domain-containing protein [Firmicutes bacterium]|nr:HDIG domain-containing protein [Bacillota bacterium]
MFFKSIKDKGIGHYLKNSTFQCALIGVFTLVISFIIVLNGAVPKRYKLHLGMVSPYDITAPRNIENTLLTEKRAEEIAKTVPSVIIRKDNVPIEVLNSVDDFFFSIESARKKINKAIQEKGLTKNLKNYDEEIKAIQDSVIKILSKEIEQLNLNAPFSEDQLYYLIAKVDDEELISFKKDIRELVSRVMTKEVTGENLALEIDIVQKELQGKELKQDLKNIGGHLLKGLIRPNSEIDNELTEEKRKEAYENAIKNNKIIVKKGSRIVSVGDVITEDKMQMLKELNLVETGNIDYAFAIGIFVMLFLLATLLLLYMKFYCRRVLLNRNDVIVLCMIIVMTLVIARFVYIYSPLLIPFSMATMLITILLDRKLAIVVNFILAIGISFMTREDLTFLYMSLLSGTFTAFFVSKVNQRSALSSTGLLIAGTNILVVVCMGLISKNELKFIVTDSLTVFTNGLISVIMTIGMLPFWESTFNLITPFKLMELANPNQTLLKRLLIEAPGTYHHSLMVGNLAEVATEALGGNSLLSRVGAYYHDIGKLKRPNFFGENQMSKNPHDRMAPSLSALVIISHTQDGVKLAEKYKLPYAIRDIIEQHHGSTLVTYFYHKAKKDNQSMTVNEDSFRYPGPKPLSKEAAVVMLADSVEAAVRSMLDRTEGKIEGLVRKIIKDKLEDGQLDLSELTLKDLDIIANSFMRVFSGFFHAREQYPDIKIKSKALEDNIHMLSETDIDMEAGVAIKVNNDVNVREGNLESDGNYNTEYTR